MTAGIKTKPRKTVKLRAPTEAEADAALDELLASAGYERVKPEEEPAAVVAVSEAGKIADYFASEEFREKCSAAQRLRREREKDLRLKNKAALTKQPPVRSLRAALAKAIAEGNWRMVRSLLP